MHSTTDCTVSVVFIAIAVAVIASVISSILTYYCCVEKKHKKRESVIIREQKDEYETVEQVKTHEEVEIQPSPAYGVVMHTEGTRFVNK